MKTLKNKLTLVAALGFALLALCPLALVTGCKSGTFNPILTGTIVQVAACELAQVKPAAKPWLTTAGNVFVMFGADTPPTPAELETKLAAIPLGNLLPSERLGVWVAVTQIYSALYNGAMTPEKKMKLKQVLDVVGTALRLGATCGVDQPANALGHSTVPTIKPTDVDRVCQAIAKALQEVK